MSQEKAEYTFEVSEKPGVVVKNIRGTITVQPGSEGQIHVQTTKHLDSGNAERTQILVNQDDSGRVTAKVKYENGALGLFNYSRPCRVDLVLTVPPTCAVEVDGVSCGITVSGVSGGLDAATVSGDLSLKEISGALQIKTVSGDVTGNNLKGELNLSTVSGDVSLDSSNFPVFKVNTVSGDLALETSLAEGPYRLRSVSGNARLTIPEETQATITLGSVSGHIAAPKSLIQQDLKAPGSRRQVAELNGGGVPIHFKSVSGDLRLVGPVAEASSQKNVSVPTVSRADILEQIAQGKLSVEEGIAQLQSTAS